jgi:hypothetical protein
LPHEGEHLKKAADNESLASSLDTSIPIAPNWAIVMLFYVAVHYVEAYFSRQSKHLVGHPARETAIQRDPKINSIFRNYRELYTYSREARYEAVYFPASEIAVVLPFLERVKKVIIPLLK